MKKILVLGGSGAMGLPLLNILKSKDEYTLFATSREKYIEEGVCWVQGNGKDYSWVSKFLRNNEFDAVVDFLNYSTNEFKERYEFILNNTNHYFFISSARVYAENHNIMDERAPRILDVCKDDAYLIGDSYDLAKARQENLLNESSLKNYTIVRPSITYNDNRLQLAIFEKDEWLYRVFDNNSIIFPEELDEIITTMTYGKDVAYAISKLLFNPLAYGETFNICNMEGRTWGEILSIYLKCLEKNMNRKIKVYRVENVEKMSRDLNRYYQYKYARGISRRFTNKKLESVTGEIDWVTPEKGLTYCINSFFKNGAKIMWPNCRRAAYYDRIVRENTPLKRFKSMKQKIGYIGYRFGLCHL